jgi:hypothetical protein
MLELIQNFEHGLWCGMRATMLFDRGDLYIWMKKSFKGRKTEATQDIILDAGK